MIILWVICGVILGWISVEVLAAMTRYQMPILFNIGMAFVGAVTAYTIINPLVACG